MHIHYVAKLNLHLLISWRGKPLQINWKGEGNSIYYECDFCAPNNNMVCPKMYIHWKSFSCGKKDMSEPSILELRQTTDAHSWTDSKWGISNAASGILIFVVIVTVWAKYRVLCTFQLHVHNFMNIYRCSNTRTWHLLYVYRHRPDGYLGNHVVTLLYHLRTSTAVV